jgi:nitrate/nitrite transporter NarK
MCWFYLTDRPEDAKWLAPDERTWLANHMNAEHAQTEKQYRYTLREALTKPRILALCFVYFGIVYGLYAVSFFLPTIIAGFKQTLHTNFTVLQQGFIVAIPFFFGAIAMYYNGKHSDATGERVWHVALASIIGGIAVPIALYLQSPYTAMAALTICVMGVCAALPTFWSLPTAFLTGAAAAGGIALINSLGNLAGFAAPYITGWLTDLTGTEKAGLWVVGLMMVAAGIVAIALKATPEPESAGAAKASVQRA